MNSEDLIERDRNYLYQRNRNTRRKLRKWNLWKEKSVRKYDKNGNSSLKSSSLASLASEIPSSAFSRGMRSRGKTRSVESFLPRGAHPRGQFSFVAQGGEGRRRKRMIGRSLESCPLGAGKCRSIYTAPRPVDRRGNAWQTAPSFY